MEAEMNPDVRPPPRPFALNDEAELREVVAKGLVNFDDWTALISAVEDKSPNDIRRISLVYDAFLSEFPLCYGYWNRYAFRKMQLCGCDEAIKVFEDAVRSGATYCVGLWVDYCQFALSSLEDPRDIRRLFGRAVSFVGKDYLCHTLWDKYIEFEYAQQEWSSLAFIYIQILKFPTKKLRQYYDSFRMLITILKEEVVHRSGTASESNVEIELDVEVQELTNDEISEIITELCSVDNRARLRALAKFSAMGKKFYEESYQLDKKIADFESRIRRSYFHVKPLGVDQIENWHLYLDFVEKQSDLDWNVSAMRLFYAWFKERTGDAVGACAAHCDFDMEDSDADFVRNVTTKANMEKRLGNFVTASNIYKEALDKAISCRGLSKCAPDLFVHYSRHLCTTTSSADTARDALIYGIRQLPQCKLLYEELIRFAITHGGREHLNAVETVVANALYSSPTDSKLLDARDAEELSNLYIKFVDQVGSINDVMKAWMQHVRSFPNFLRDAAIANHAQDMICSKSVAAESQRTCVFSDKATTDSNGDRTIKHGLDSTRNLVPERRDSQSEQHNVTGANNGVLHATQSRAPEQLGHTSPNAGGLTEDASELESHQSELKYLKDSNLQGTDQINKPQTSPSLEKLSLDHSQYQPFQSMPSFYNNEGTCEETRASEGIVLVGGSHESRRFPAENWSGSQRTGKVSNTYNRSQAADGGFPSKDKSSSPALDPHEERGNDNQGWGHLPSDKFPRDSKFGPRGHLRKKSNYPQHSTSSSHKQADIRIPIAGQGLSEAINNHQSFTNTTAWPMQNLHQPPNFVQQNHSQQSAVGTQVAPMFQNPMQSSEQPGNNVQNGQAYDTMWQQYYYYQAQQQIVAQQQQSIQMTQTVNQSQMLPQQSYDPQQLQHYYQQQWQLHQQQLQAQHPLQQQQHHQQFYHQEQQQLPQLSYNQQQQQCQQLPAQQLAMHQSYEQQQQQQQPPQQGEPPQDLHKLNKQHEDQVKRDNI
ncbi:hypothetical protein MLD38_010324 [Melastoma candidum]|uniref:Uncharacterized protein n=1 Tax=Melastoma candidum TaxID=119954 RepID=A0ACB9QZG8_9MYRT|nr:hypothetical protein MLD38_010324 [Melastoma candidum]